MEPECLLTTNLQLREGRRADLEKHVEEVNALLKRPEEDTQSEIDGAEEEEHWEGFTESPEIAHEAEYVDDDRFTTVTVEAVDVSRDGFHKVRDDTDGESNVDDKVEQSKSGQEEDQEKTAKGKRTWTKERPGGPKKRKKKFRYESKAERKITRYKEKLGNKKQARERKS